MPRPEIQGYYNRGKEQDRLLTASGKLERIRTQELLSRYLPPGPATIADIGGGAGIHALWLAEQGYAVHLRDMMPLHIEQALADAKARHLSLASASVGDACKIDLEDNMLDAVLLLGPLYHLQDKVDRLQALCEAYRVLKPSGVLLAATISRYASLLDGLIRGFFADSHYADLVDSALNDGRHGNETLEPQYFTTAYFHHPDEIPVELAAANFQFAQTLPIEGPAAFVREFDVLWDDEQQRERYLTMIRQLETDPYILGASSHNMSIAYKK